MLLPECRKIDEVVARNRVEQLLHAEKTVEVSVLPRAGNSDDKTIYIAETTEGERIAIVPRGASQPADCTRAIMVEDTTSIESALDGITQPSARWLGRRHQTSIKSLEATAQELAGIRSQWPTPFTPAQERYDGDVLVAPGLRPPQIGALYAVLGHWTASHEAVTVVMPTGSGKTDTMVSLLVGAPITGLLVVVPSDPLREQTVNKFKTLGVLTKIGLISSSLPLPVVATMKSAPRTVEEVQLLCSSAHVIVATDKALSSMKAELLDAFVQSLSHLFVDEAHHVGARTWRTIKQRFMAHRRPIVQFTATPFRNDGKRVDGRHIYTYPLRRAQDDKLFKPVMYEPVHALSKDRADEIIARKAAEVLDRDLAAGLDHLAMARCDKIDRAEEVLAIYRALVPSHRAELVHNKMPKAQRRAILKDLKRGAVRIIVCVKMLGEGFDLPRLKIAALHDPQQSEAPTLQFIGRFTRVEKGLGDATVIAAVASHSEKEWLANLYKSDADWNHLLRRTSGHLTETERRREDLFRDMVGEFAQVLIETITPKLSCRIFKLPSDDWHPDRLSEVETSRISVVDGPIINHERALVMATLRSEDYLDWTRSRQPVDVSFRLIMAHYHEEQQLLYVSTTGDDQLATRIAELIGGEGTTPVGGESVFRVLHGFRRTMLTSLGVKETDVKPVRFQMSSGIDIVAQLDALADNRTRIKTNLFATGFVDEPILDADEGDETQSVQRGIGCSTKGKIWAADKCSNPGEWIDWCRRYGSKIVDESIGTAAIMRGVLRPKRQEARPLGRIPISVDWPEAWLDRNEDRLALIFEDGHEALFSECDFAVAEHRPDGPIPLEIRSKGRRIAISFDIVGKAMAFTCSDACRLRTGSKEQPLQVALQDNPPSIRFTDGAFMQGLELAELTEMDSTDFDADTIATIDWTGVDLKAESLGPERNPNSVQGRVIRHLNTARPGSEIIFDGDVSGEVADIIELQRHGRLLDVHLYHCKYMLGASPGGRINELYEVCGQAMKSVRWANPGSDFLKRMLQQEERRLAAGQTSRFIKGDRYIVERWIAERGEFRTRFHVTIVQPGYSKSKVNRKHLPLLGSLRAYLMSTYAIDLTVWTSP